MHRRKQNRREHNRRPGLPDCRLNWNVRETVRCDHWGSGQSLLRIEGESMAKLFLAKLRRAPAQASQDQSAAEKRLQVAAEEELFKYRRNKYRRKNQDPVHRGSLRLLHHLQQLVLARMLKFNAVIKLIRDGTQKIGRWQDDKGRENTLRDADS